jgi:hypothetical protein
MKTLLVLALFAFNSMAATEYNCQIKLTRVRLILDAENSKVMISDAQTNQYIDHGRLHEKIESNGETDLMFEMDTSNFIQARFKSDALKEEPETLFGLIRGSAGFQILDSSVKCFKK